MRRAADLAALLALMEDTPHSISWQARAQLSLA